MTTLDDRALYASAIPPAVDAPESQRPGVPMETAPRPVGSAHWKELEPQEDPGHILKRKGLDTLTPIFGTTIPPRGLSGLMRRAAYQIEEHRTSHWFLLLLADRVDAIEHEPLAAAKLALPVAALGGLALAARTLTSKKRKSRK